MNNPRVNPFAPSYQYLGNPPPDLGMSSTGPMQYFCPNSGGVGDGVYYPPMWYSPAYQLQTVAGQPGQFCSYVCPTVFQAPRGLGYSFPPHHQPQGFYPGRASSVVPPFGDGHFFQGTTDCHSEHAAANRERHEPSCPNRDSMLNTQGSLYNADVSGLSFTPRSDSLFDPAPTSTFRNVTTTTQFHHHQKQRKGKKMKRSAGLVKSNSAVVVSQQNNIFYPAVKIVESVAEDEPVQPVDIPASDNQIIANSANAPFVPQVTIEAPSTLQEEARASSSYPGIRRHDKAVQADIKMSRFKW